MPDTILHSIHEMPRRDHDIIDIMRQHNRERMAIGILGLISLSLQIGRYPRMQGIRIPARCEQKPTKMVIPSIEILLRPRKLIPHDWILPQHPHEIVHNQPQMMQKTDLKNSQPNPHS